MNEINSSIFRKNIYLLYFYHIQDGTSERDMKEKYLLNIDDVKFYSEKNILKIGKCLPEAELI